MSFLVDKISRLGGDSFNLFDSVGNFFLKPARYLWNGKHVNLIYIPKSNEKIDLLSGGIVDSSIPFFSKAEKSEEEGFFSKIFKTTLSVVFLAPFSIIGGLFKGASWVFDSRVREAHWHFSLFKTKYQNDPIKIDQAAAVGKVVLGVMQTIVGRGDSQQLKQAFDEVPGPNRGPTVQQILDKLSDDQAVTLEAVARKEDFLATDKLTHLFVSTCVSAYSYQLCDIDTCRKAIVNLPNVVRVIQTDPDFPEGWKTSEDLQEWFKREHLNISI